MDFALENPEVAYEMLCQILPKLRTPTYKRIFVNCLPYFSRDLQNVPRDWEKVGRYASHLGIAPKELDFTDHYTNEYIPLEGYADMAPLS